MSVLLPSIFRKRAGMALTPTVLLQRNTRLILFPLLLLSLLAHTSDEDRQAYISASRRASSVIAKAKAEARQTTCSSLSPKSNPKSVHSLLRSIAGSSCCCCCCWLPDLFRGIGAWQKTMEPQKPGNCPGSEPEVVERQRVAKE